MDGVAQKYPIEVIPFVFDFKKRLGALAPGASVASVEALSVAPTGDADDLDIGTVGTAIVDEVSELAVQVVASKGRSYVLYKVACQATISHAGSIYVLVVEDIVYVRG